VHDVPAPVSRVQPVGGERLGSLRSGEGEIDLAALREDHETRRPVICFRVNVREVKGHEHRGDLRRPVVATRKAGCARTDQLDIQV
jgi:hypothetical protein